MAVRAQETLIAVCKKRQTDVATASTTPADYWRMEKLNGALLDVNLNTETDADWYGKGNEFATQSFKTSWDVSGTLEKYCSAETMAWAWLFVLGAGAKTGTTPNWIYTSTPRNTATDAKQLELDYFSFIEKTRSGSNVVIDRMAVGCALESVEVALTSGPGMGNAKITCQFVGTGKITEPSGFDFTSPLDVPLAENYLNASSAVISINGVNYVTNKNLLSLNFGWKNNIRLDDGFFIGCGFQSAGDATSGEIRGRLELGKRAPTASFTARFDKNSTEWNLLKSQATGTFDVTLTRDANNSFEATYQRMNYAMTKLGETNDVITAAVTVMPQYVDDTTGILTCVGKCVQPSVYSL